MAQLPLGWRLAAIRINYRPSRRRIKKQSSRVPRSLLDRFPIERFLLHFSLVARDLSTISSFVSPPVAEGVEDDRPLSRLIVFNDFNSLFNFSSNSRSERSGEERSLGREKLRFVLRITFYNERCQRAHPRRLSFPSSTHLLL